MKMRTGMVIMMKITEVRAVREVVQQARRPCGVGATIRLKEKTNVNVKRGSGAWMLKRGPEPLL